MSVTTTKQSSYYEQAKAGISYLFGWGSGTPVWRPEADRLKLAIETARDMAQAAEGRARPLLTACNLVPGGGMTGLRAAIAQAKQENDAAQTESKRANESNSALMKHLTSNSVASDAMGDTRPIVAAAAQAATDTKKIWDALRAAAQVSEEWHAQYARANGGLAIRLKAIQTDPGPPKSDKATGAFTTLNKTLTDAAAGGFNAGKVGESIKQAIVLAGTLEKAIAEQEGKGGDPLPRLRQAEIIQFHNTVNKYDLDAVLEEAAKELRQDDSDKDNARIQAHHLASLSPTLNTLPRRLADALEKATDPAGIATALDSAIDEYRRLAGQLATDVRNGSLLPAALKKGQAAVKAELDAGRFEKQKSLAEEKLRALRVSGAEEYQDLKGEFDTLVADAYKTRGYGKAADELEKLVATVEQTFDEHIEKYQDAISDLEAEVEKARQDLGKAIGRLKGPAVESIKKAITERLADADNYLDCGGNFEAAEGPVRAILTEVGTMITGFGDLVRKRDEVEKIFQKIDGQLTNPALTKIPPETLAGMKETLAGLRAAGGDVSVDALRQQADDLANTVTEQINNGAAIELWRKTAKQELAALTLTYTAFASAVSKKKPADFNGQMPDPAKGQIKADLDLLGGQIDISIPDLPLHRTTWTTSKKGVEAALKGLWDFDKKTLLNLNLVADDSKAGLQQAARVEEIGKKCAELIKNAKASEKDVQSAGGDMGELTALIKQLEALPARAKADPDGGELELKDIEARLVRVRGSKDFNAAMAKAIGEIPGQWTGVLSRTQGHLMALTGAVVKAVKGTPFESSLGQLRPMIDGAGHPFEADAFTEIVRFLKDTEDDTDKRTERRKKREEALLKIRQYQSRLFDDPLFQHLQTNGFGISPFGELFRFLDKAELEFLRLAP